MRVLNKLQACIFLIGAVLMVVGAGISLFGWRIAPFVFATGAFAFATMQIFQRYEGSNVTLRRLRRIMIISDLLFLLSAALMFASQNNPLGLSQITYIQYVHNKWVGTLLLAALIQLYATHRIEHELAKEAKKL